MDGAATRANAKISPCGPSEKHWESDGELLLGRFLEIGTDKHGISQSDEDRPRCRFSFGSGEDFGTLVNKVVAQALDVEIAISIGKFFHRRRDADVGDVALAEQRGDGSGVEAAGDEDGDGG